MYTNLCNYKQHLVFKIFGTDEISNNILNNLKNSLIIMLNDNKISINRGCLSEILHFSISKDYVISKSYLGESNTFELITIINDVLYLKLTFNDKTSTNTKIQYILKELLFSNKFDIIVLEEFYKKRPSRNYRISYKKN